MARGFTLETHEHERDSSDGGGIPVGWDDLILLMATMLLAVGWFLGIRVMGTPTLGLGALFAGTGFVANRMAKRHRRGTPETRSAGGAVVGEMGGGDRPMRDKQRLLPSSDQP